ncbi:META domain-containing protein [Microbacterium timonense]|jgi:hypothetical protein|uniref:META domain-containing protein n=1 Tax=Microbacterium timonense TaxID=2086576 RepID=UPI000D10EA85|nr:META domain-containing protein [Microbacterium timonense]
MRAEDDQTRASRARSQRPDLELFLWVLLPVILVVVHIGQIFEQFSTVGCEGICDLDFSLGARAAYPWEVAASVGIALLLAVVLRLTGKVTYVAPLAGVVLVLSSAIITSLLFHAGLAPMYERNARIAQGYAPPAPAPPIPDPTGSWGTGAEGAPYLVFSSDGTFAGNDGCNDVNGQWTQNPDGRVMFSTLTATANVCDGVDTWLSEGRSATVADDFLYINGSAGSPIGGLPPAP